MGETPWTHRGPSVGASLTRSQQDALVTMKQGAGGRYVTASEVGIAGATLASLARLGLVERAPDTLNPSARGGAYAEDKRWKLTGRGLAKAGAIIRSRG